MACSFSPHSEPFPDTQEPYLQLSHFARIQGNSRYLRSVLPRHNTAIPLLESCHLPKSLCKRRFRDCLFSDPTNSSGLSSKPTYLGLGQGPESQPHRNSFLGIHQCSLPDYLLSLVTEFFFILHWKVWESSQSLCFWNSKDKTTVPFPLFCVATFFFWASQHKLVWLVIHRRKAKG